MFLESNLLYRIASWSWFSYLTSQSTFCIQALLQKYRLCKKILLWNVQIYFQIKFWFYYFSTCAEKLKFYFTLKTVHTSLHLVFTCYPFPPPLSLLHTHYFCFSILLHTLTLFPSHTHALVHTHTVYLTYSLFPFTHTFSHSIFFLFLSLSLSPPAAGGRCGLSGSRKQK